MNKEQILNVMGHVDPALIEGVDCAKTKKRMPRIARAGLVAACLCAALMGTAFAVETVTGVSIREYFAGQGFGEVMQRIDPMFQASEEDNYSGYVIQRTGEGVSLVNVSEEVLAFSQEQIAAGEVPYKMFASLEELEAYLGLDLYDNEMLERVTDMEYQETHLYEDDGLTEVTFEKTRGATLMCSSDEEGLIYISVMDYYATSDGYVSVQVAAEAVRSGFEAGEIAYAYTDGTQFTEEIYTTERGEEVVIIRCDCPPQTEWEKAYTTYVAHFYVDGVRYCVSVESRQEPEHGLKVLKDILDAFEFKEIS